MDPLDLTGPGFTIDQFKVFAIKSRVHFAAVSTIRASRRQFS
jgi:hypothetical protein